MSNMVDISKMGKHSSEVLLFIYSHEPIILADLKTIISGPQTYRRIVNKLTEEGLLILKERVRGRKEIEIILTDRGRRLAASLQEIQEEMIFDFSAKFNEKFKKISNISQSYGKKDHIALNEQNFDESGNNRIVHIFTRFIDNNVIRLWCEVHDNFSCIHTDFAWPLPEVQEMVQNQVLEVKKND